MVLLIACLCAYSGSENLRVGRLRRELRQTMEKMGREREPVEIEQLGQDQDCPGLLVRMASPRSAGLVCLIQFLAARQGCRIIGVDGPQPSSQPDLVTERLRSQGQRQLDLVFGPGRAVVLVNCRFFPRHELPASAPLLPKRWETYGGLPMQTFEPNVQQNASSLEISQMSVWLLLNVPRQREVLPLTMGLVRDSLGVDECRGDSVHYLPLPEGG